MKALYHVDGIYNNDLENLTVVDVSENKRTAKNLYKITLQGCDDKTEIRRLLNDDQLEFLKDLAKMFKRESTYSCMPVMKITKIRRRKAE